MQYRFLQTKQYRKEYSDSPFQKKIRELLGSICDDGINKGLGKPEFLKYMKVYSRRINDNDRLLYKLKDDLLTIELISCKGHY